MTKLIHGALSLLVLSLGIGCLVAADPSGESEGAGEGTTESAAGDEIVGESSDAIVGRGTPIGGIRGGGKCGDNVSGPGTFCCNASCGTCAPLGGACTQQVCPPRE
jgi:hypothetical protein